MDLWAPAFAIQLRIGREDMLGMSLPQIVAHMDHWNEITKGAAGG